VQTKNLSGILLSMHQNLECEKSTLQKPHILSETMLCQSFISAKTTRVYRNSTPFAFTSPFFRGYVHYTSSQNWTHTMQCYPYVGGSPLYRRRRAYPIQCDMSVPRNASESVYYSKTY